MAAKVRVVIVGAGFGGLWATKTLDKADVSVTLIDRNNYHTFLPLLYQVAACEVEPGDIAQPVRTIVRQQDNVNFVMAEATHVDWEANVLHTSAGTFGYDYLILALGSKTNTYGIPGADEHALQLKTIAQGIELRNHVLRCFEEAVTEENAARRRELLTFAIVGGGPTGVEYAGALSELIRRPLARDFKQIDIDDVRVVLLEAQGSLLGYLPPRLGRYTATRLEKMGVELMLGAKVAKIEANALHLADGTQIGTHSTIWTAGVQAESLAKMGKIPIARGGRLEVLPTLQLADQPNVFAVGDMANVQQDGSVLPMVAQPAMQGGTRAAKNILRLMRGEAAQPFRYRDLGTMATIGRNSAVAEIGRLPITGFLAWIMWLFIHLVNLIGFRNRLAVLLNWAWNYLFFERVARLILDSSDAQRPPA